MKQGSRPQLPPWKGLLDLVSDLSRRSWRTVDAEHYLDDYERSQWLAPPLLRELQLAALRRLVWHCLLHVPAYAQRIGERLAPSRIEGLDAVDPLPIGSAALRRIAPETYRAVGAEPRPASQRSTAGTRGPRQPVLLDGEAVARQAALRLRSERWAGAPPAKLVAVWQRDTLRRPRALEAAELRALRVALDAAGTSALSRWGGLGGGREAIVTVPAESLVELGSILEPAARDGLRRARLRAVIARGEDPGHRGRSLVEKLGVPFIAWYGAAEVGVIAAPCERGGLHVHADHLLVEVVGDDGSPCAPGHPGRLLITDLYNYAAPYLRHELEDLARWLPRPCACGRSLPLLELLGRAP